MLHHYYCHYCDAIDQNKEFQPDTDFEEKIMYPVLDDQIFYLNI